MNTSPPSSSVSYLVQQVAELRQQVAELKAQRVTYVPGEVTDTDTGTSTFSAQVAGMVDGSTVPLSGIAAPPSFLPTIGDTVLIALSGAQPVYQPGRIGAGSVGTAEIAQGAVTTGQLAFDLADYSGNTVFYGPDIPQPPATGFSVGDLWLQTTGNTGTDGQPNYVVYRWNISGQWVLLQDQGISNSLAQALTAQQTADGKATLFTGSATPTYTGDAGTAYWISGPDNVPQVWDGTAWVPYQLGNGAFQPNSIIASDVIATGTVSAALLEAMLVLVTDIIAGDPNGTHAVMAPDGLHIFDAAGDEVIRLGTTDNDYFGVVDSTGNLVASIDATGQGNLNALNVIADPVFGGVALADRLSQIPGGGGSDTPYPGAANVVGARHEAVISGVSSEVGLVEIATLIEAGRGYWIVPEVYWSRSDPSTYLIVRVRDGGSSAPDLSSPVLFTDYFTGGATTSWLTLAQRHRVIHFTAAGTHRLLLTVQAGGAGTVNIDNTLNDPNLTAIDLGRYANVGSVNRGGGGTPPPDQQYYSYLAPAGGRGAGYWSFRGDGVLRTDTTDVVQGLDPSGFNGDGRGQWKFALPAITGSVDRVDLYLWSRSTYYNSGGKAKISLTDGPGTANPVMLETIWTPGVTYPKPGGVSVTLPSSWYAAFKNKSSIGITVGPGGSDELYYVRFDGPGARLSVWYTQ